MTGEYEPCGGCGANHPSKRCIGCFHDFGGSNGSIPYYGDKPPTVTAFEAVGSQWRLRVNEEDPWSPWHDGSAPFPVPDGCETDERTVYAITIGGHDGNSTIRKADTGSDLLSANAIAEALEACDWSGSPIGNKAILRTAAHALRCVNRETFEVAEGFEVAPDDGRATGELQPVTPITTVKMTVPVDPSDAMISATEASKMNDDQIKHMVQRFLSWKLPENFNPDGGVSFKRTFIEHTPRPMKHEPCGTNLLNAIQAEAMIRHLLVGLPPALQVQPIAYVSEWTKTQLLAGYEGNFRLTIKNGQVALFTAPPAPHVTGWLYDNEDTGREYSDDHPVESGEVPDATNIVPATAENLLVEMKSAWKAWGEDRVAIAQMSDEMADYKKRQCQYDFEARIRSVLAPIAATEGSDNG